MIARCENPKSKQFCNYGGRGIKVCEEWRRDFSAFEAYLGHKPSPDHYMIDRIDNNLGYQPGNVRWATATEQTRNKRSNVWIELDGERLIQADAARKLGVSQTTAFEMARDGRLKVVA